MTRKRNPLFVRMGTQVYLRLLTIMIVFSYTPHQGSHCFYPYERNLSHMPDTSPWKDKIRTETCGKTSDVIIMLVTSSFYVTSQRNQELLVAFIEK